MVKSTTSSKFKGIINHTISNKINNTINNIKKITKYTYEWGFYSWDGENCC